MELGTIDDEGRQVEMNYDMAACAEMSEQYEAVPSMLLEAARSDTPEDVLLRPDNKMYWYKMSVGSGGLLAQCFECMRACPIATRSPLSDPIRRATAAEAAREAGE